MPRFSGRDGGEWEYDDTSPIGDESGMGQVFRGSSLADGRPVAVKRIGLKGLTTGEERRREREIEIAGHLDVAARSGDETEHLVLPLDHAFAGADLMIVMPLADGSLNATLERGRFSVDKGISALRDVAQGLVELAAISVVHRDLKPANVLRLDGTWKITDFGLSRILTETTGTYTMAGWGTRQYVAPELWRNQPATAKSDLYALGVVAYELFTGSRPFTGPDFSHQHQFAAPPGLPGLPAALDRLVNRLLAKEPAQRPQDARAVVEALDKMVQRLTPQQQALIEAARRRDRTVQTSRLAAVAAAEETEKQEQQRRQARADLADILAEAYDDIVEALPDAELDTTAMEITVSGVRAAFHTYPPVRLTDEPSPVVLMGGVFRLPVGETRPRTGAPGKQYAVLTCRLDATGRLAWELSDGGAAAPWAHGQTGRPLDADGVIEVLRAVLED
jgi:hypothetical protein